jgi:hypothetical protein
MYFNKHRKSCSDFGLPAPIHMNLLICENIDLYKEKVIADNLYSLLNEDQSKAANQILQAINKVDLTSKAFFIDGPGIHSSYI